MPLLPRMDIPPTIPNAGFRVFRASSSPFSTAISSVKTSSISPKPMRIRLSFIILRGPGLIAGYPGATANPGRVTRPTPLPPQIINFPRPQSSTRSPAPAVPPRTTFTLTIHLSVTSGSSPASFCTANQPSGRALTRIFNTTPPGRINSSCGRISPPVKYRYPAKIAAAAALPVVKPSRNSFTATPLRSP